MRVVRLLVALVIALHIAGSAFAAVPLPPEKEQWLTLTSGEFHLYSNASERETRQLATGLLRMREAIGKITRLNVRSTKPTHVFLFRNERSFAPFRDAVFQRKRAAVSGGFISDERANFIILQGDAPGGVSRVVYHELAHYFLRNTRAELPLWVHEGMAEYYSTFDANDEKVSLGRPVVEHISWLRDGNVMPLSDLLTIDTESPDYSEERRQGVFYAQSWALIHYLLVGNPERRAQFPRFLALAAEGKPIEDAFRTAFEGSYADIEKELRNYLRRPTMTYTTYSLDELQIPAIADAAPLERDELLTALGMLLSTHSATVADALPFFDESLRLDPKNAQTYAALGRAHDRRNDPQAAVAAFEKAIALGTTDPNAYLFAGVTSLNRLAGTTAPPQQELMRTRQLFERALQLDANSALALAGLGATYVGTDEDPAPGIAALEKSLSLNKAEDAAFNLVQLYGKSGRRADAQRVFDAVLARSKDAEVVRQGREAVLFAAVREAESLMESGRDAEAAKLMREIASQTTNPQLKAHLQQTLSAHDQQDAREMQVETINAALVKANAGKYAEALKMIDDLLPNITDSQMRDQVKELRAELAKQLKRK